MTPIQLERFNPKKHYAVVCSWIESWGASPIEISDLPEVGFFVGNTCAGFLYQTDSDVALIEGLVSAKGSDPSERDHAIDAGVKFLLEEAHSLGFRSVYAFTRLPGVIARAKRHGFTAGNESYRLATRRL